MRGGTSLAILLGAAIGAASTARPAGDSDVYWHLATAKEALAHGIVRSDVFSWTVSGQPVSTDQWLGQLLLYGAYLADGWAGVVLLRGVVIALLVAFVFVNARIAAPDAGPLSALLATLPAIFLSRFVWAERPELFGFACFAVLLVLLRLGRSGSDGAVALAAPLLAIWANLHGSFALGAVLLVLVAAEGALRDVARRRTYVLVALAGALATLLTPAGIGSWTSPGFHLLSPPRELQEWAAPDPRTAVGALLAITLAVVILTGLFSRSLPLREAIILVPVALLSVTAVRQAPLIAIAAAPYLAVRAPEAYRNIRTRLGIGTRAGAPKAGSRGLGVISLVTAAILAAIAVSIAPSEPDESPYPVAALAVLPAGPGLFNHYDWGGWLIWHAPATPVFIDGRYTPYRCCHVLEDYRTVIAAEPGWSEVLARRGARAILVRRGDGVAIRGIESGWTILARGAEWVLLRVP